MSRQRIVIGCMVGLLASLSGSLPSLAMPPTVSEVLAVHRANRDKLTPLHVQWTSTQEWTDAFRTVYQQKAELFTTHEAAIVEATLQYYETQLKQHADDINVDQAGAPKVTPDQIRRMIRNEARTAKLSAETTRGRTHIELFLRGDNLQIRMPSSPASSEAAQWTFPTTPLTAESLSMTYREITIKSRTGGPSPKTCIWHGSSSAAITTSKPPGDSLPPFSASAKSHGGQLHPLDIFFFSQPAERYRIVGAEQHEERTLTVMMWWWTPIVRQRFPTRMESPGRSRS